MRRTRTLFLSILIALLAIPTLSSCSGGSEKADQTTTTEYVSMVVNTTFSPPDDSFHTEYPVEETDKTVYARTILPMGGRPEHTQYFTELHLPSGTEVYSVAVYPYSLDLAEKIVSGYENWDCTRSTGRDPVLGICTTSNQERTRVEMLTDDGVNLYLVKATSGPGAPPTEAKAFTTAFQLPVDA
jgi:hypothetical protein